MSEKVCVRTLRKEIKHIGFHNRVATKKPFLSDKHKADRLAFAKKYQAWEVLDWMNVIWTDEASFEIGRNSLQVKVWRRPYERYSWDCLAPIFKSGHTSIMIWGAFIGYEKCPIVVMPSDKWTSADFVDNVYEGRLSGFSICMMILKVFSSWRMVPQCIVVTYPNNGKKLIR